MKKESNIVKYMTTGYFGAMITWAFLSPMLTAQLVVVVLGFLALVSAIFLEEKHNAKCK